MGKKVGLNIAVVVLAVGAGVYLSRKPWIVYREQQQKASSANQEMRDAEKSLLELQKQQADLDSPLGRETQARKIGMRKSGETTLDRP
jgi:hypothetical protein